MRVAPCTRTTRLHAVTGTSQQFSDPEIGPALLSNMRDAHEAQVIQLRVQTFTDPQPERPSCSGSLTCSCLLCAQEKQARVLRGIQPRKPQPWQPKPPRALRDAA